MLLNVTWPTYIYPSSPAASHNILLSLVDVAVSFTLRTMVKQRESHGVDHQRWKVTSFYASIRVVLLLLRVSTAYLLAYLILYLCNVDSHPRIFGEASNADGNVLQQFLSRTW